MRDDCRIVREELAAIVDGDAATLAHHADHLAGCDDCRDARHEAARIAALLARAGDDHADVDVEARLLAALDGEAPATAPAPVAPAPVAPTPAPTPAPTTIARVDEPARAEAPVPIARGLAARRRRMLLGVTGLAAIAATSIAYVAARDGGDRGGRTIAAAPTGWSGSVARVRRAAADGVAGATVLPAGASAADPAAWQPLVEGAPLAAGSRVRTDDRTRLWLALADGSSLVLDHATELALATGSARRLELAAGRVAADIASRGDTASVVTSRARLDVVGTRFIVTASPELTAVQVSQGSVALTAATGGAPVDVRAGEEGAVAGGAPEIAPVPAMASETAWAEVPPPATADDAAAGGVGALRAFKPGERRDRDWNLALARHDVQVRVAGPIARTEITETFRNDSDHVLEGVYQFPLPADARIDSLALDVGGGFEQGAFVDRERAGKIWRGVIDRAAPRRERPPLEIIWVPGPWRDPALLEWQRGGRFELRVFPIPAHGARTIKLAYTQVVAPHGRWRQYTYPLAHSADGSTVAERFTVDVEVRGAQAGAVRTVGYDLASKDVAGGVGFTLDKAAFVPRGDLRIDFRPADADAELRAWTFAGNAAVAPDARLVGKKGVGLDPKVIEAQRALAADPRPTAVLALRPALPRWRETRPRDVVFVVDRSQSMVGERLDRARALVGAALEQLDRRDRFTVLACDSDCETLGPVQAPSPQALTQARGWLAAQTAAGASDVVAAVRAAADAVAADDREDWIVYVGDGFASTGFRRAADVEAAVSATSAARGVRVTTVAIGNDADDAVLSAVARAGGGSMVAWHPGLRPAQAALAVIETTRGAALRDATVELPAGLVDVAPAVLPTLRAGEELLIGARIAQVAGGELKGDVVLRGTVGGQPFEQRYPLALAVSSAAGNGFVPRLWASLAIDQLERGGKGEDRARVVALSQGYGVMSRQTSLLVLESQAMFDAFGIDRGQPSAAWTGEDAIEEATTAGVLALADGTLAGGDVGGGLMAGGGGEAQSKPAATRARSAALDEQLGSSMFDTLAGTDEPSVAADPAPSTTTAGATATPARIERRGEGAKKNADKGAKSKEEARPDPDLMRRRGFVPMKKVWYRVAAIGAAAGPSANLRAAIDAARASLAEQPDSRERHRALVQALAFAGELDGAREVAERWLERDRLDPEALGYLADLLGRQGHAAQALRTQAGTVDLAPDRVPLHEAMAAAYDRAGRLGQACAHRVALASLRRDARTAGAALRCLRGLGRTTDADLIVRGLADDALRTAAEKAATAAPLPLPIAGDLVLDGVWEAGHDLDVALVTPQGKRISWLGGKADLAVRDHRANDREALALRRLPRGNYLVEVSRSDARPGVVRGTVTVGALGQRRTLPFELTGDRAVVGTVAVSVRSRLVRVDGW
jgi:tetratricopeptide (TPR) repeat protein